MDTKQIIELIEKLSSQGEIQIAVLVAVGAALILFQWKIIRELTNVIKAADEHRKMIEASRKEIELNQKTIETNHSKQIEISEKQIQLAKLEPDRFKENAEFMKSMNHELREEIKRIKDDQKKFEHNVKKSIEIGLNEVKSKLKEITVSELLSEIPPAFREDTEKELAQASENIIRKIIEKLKGSPDEFTDIRESVKEIVKQELPEIKREAIDATRYILHDDRIIDEIAFRTARYLYDRDFPNRRHPWY